MGEKQNQPFQLSFNSSLKVDSQGSRVTTDGGLLLVRELDQRLGLSELISEHLTDGRRGKNTQHTHSFIRNLTVESIGAFDIVFTRVIQAMEGPAAVKDALERIYSWALRSHQIDFKSLIQMLGICWDEHVAPGGGVGQKRGER